MLFLDGLVEEDIEAEIRRGEFDALEGAGQPLVFEDESLEPEKLRVACRLPRSGSRFLRKN